MLQAWEALTLHSHDAVDRGQDMHMQAAPSQAEALARSFKAKKTAMEGRNKASVLATYGSAADQPDEEAQRLAQLDGYVEYNAQGRVIKGQVQQVRAMPHQDAMAASPASCALHQKQTCGACACCCSSVQVGRAHMSLAACWAAVELVHKLYHAGGQRAAMHVLKQGYSDQCSGIGECQPEWTLHVASYRELQESYWCARTVLRAIHKLESGDRGAACRTCA